MFLVHKKSSRAPVVKICTVDTERQQLYKSSLLHKSLGQETNKWQWIKIHNKPTDGKFSGITLPSAARESKSSRIQMSVLLPKESSWTWKESGRQLTFVTTRTRVRGQSDMLKHQTC